MEWVNYHHLLYFRTVAKEGSITRASKELSLAQPTISGQIRALEETLGAKLFARQGRNLVLTDFGRTLYRYADEIFTLGQEMTEMLQGQSGAHAQRLSIGSAKSMCKVLVHCLLSPLTRLAEPVQLLCIEDTPENLVDKLEVHSVDLVLTDAPVNTGTGSRVFHQLLGASGVTVFAPHGEAVKYRQNFPGSLEGAPFLLPSHQASLRRQLNHWFVDNQLTPRIAAEFQDGALLEAFACSGEGLFVAPTAVENEISKALNVDVVGRISSVQERVYAMSLERKLKHSAVEFLFRHAREHVFADAAAAASGQDEAA